MPVLDCNPIKHRVQDLGTSSAFANCVVLFLQPSLFLYSTPIYLLFSDKEVIQNKNIEFIKIDLNQSNFIEKYFFANFFTIQIAYHLGLYNDTEGRDLISIAAGNPWWSQKNIEFHPDCSEIPGILTAEETAYALTREESHKEEALFALSER